MLASACAGYQREPLPPSAEWHPEPTLHAAALRVSGKGWASEAQHLEVNPDDGLAPDEAAVLSVLLDPELVAERDARGEGRAQVIAAGILPNPVLGAEYAHPYGSGSTGTTDVVNLTLAFDWKPLFGRSARQSSAAAAYEQIDLGIAWQEWQVAERARLLVVRLQWLRHRIQLARSELDLQAQVAEAMSQASGAGDATLGQLGVQLASREAARRSVHELEQSALEAEDELRSLLGPWQPPQIDVPEPGGAAEPAVPDLARCLAGRLDLAALERGYQAEDASVREAVAEQFPDLTLGIEHQHNEAGLSFVGAFVNVGLPLFDRNQGRVEQALATRLRLRHEYDARVAAVRLDIARLLRFAALAAGQRRDVEQAIPALEKIELQERAAVTRGDLDRLSYQTLRSSLFEQRMQGASLSQALAEAAVGLRTACGPEPRQQEER